MLGFYRAGLAVRNLGLGSHIRVTSHNLQSKFRDERRSGALRVLRLRHCGDDLI